jgi:hypothetical protein
MEKIIPKESSVNIALVVYKSPISFRFVVLEGTFVTFAHCVSPQALAILFGVGPLSYVALCLIIDGSRAMEVTADEVSRI